MNLKEIPRGLHTHFQSALFFFLGSPHCAVSANLPVTMAFRNFKFVVSARTISAKTRVISAPATAKQLEPLGWSKHKAQVGGLLPRSSSDKKVFLSFLFGLFSCAGRSNKQDLGHIYVYIGEVAAPPLPLHCAQLRSGIVYP